jgi:hypothetical protein
MTKPIPDKAEVAVEYPDKLYIGTFERTARFDGKTVRMHFHYALFAEILQDLAKTVASLPAADLVHREALRDAVKSLYLALEGGGPPSEAR